MNGVGTAIASINQLVSAGRTGVSVAKAVRQLLSGDLRWLNVGTDVDMYSMSEVADINAFLGSGMVAPLLQLTWIGLALDGEQPEAALSAKTTFKAAAVTWCATSGGKWDRRADAVWDAVAARIRGLLPRQLPDDLSTQADQQRFLWGPLDDPTGRAAVVPRSAPPRLATDR